MPQGRNEARSKHGPTDSERALKAENSRLMADNRKLRRQIGDAEWLIEQIEQRTLGQELPKIKQAPRIKPKDKVYRRPLEAVLFVADPHMEEVVDPDETEGMLEWNMDVFLRSAWHMVNAAIDLVGIMRARHSVEKLHIAFLGDMVTGEIHPDVYYTNAFYLPDALTMGPWYWAQAVRELSAHFESVQCTCIAGNHGRLDHKPTSKRAVGRNWDTCLYQNAAVQTRALENVKWIVPRSPKCVINVNTWRFLLQHGDRVPQHGGVTPYYGMARQRSADTVKRIGRKVDDIEGRKDLMFDYDVRGHHHLYGCVDERTILCPSMMGNNEFGMDNVFSHKMPGARLSFVDDEHGIAGDWRINLANCPDDHGFEQLPKWTVGA